MLKSLVAMDFVERLGKSLTDNGWYIDAVSQRYSCAGRVFHNPDKPWIYVNPVSGAACNVYQAIVDQCKFIPTPCLKCWKVVVKPRTLYELMQLYKFQMEFTKDHMGEDRYCKCGIETRAYVPQNYGGYFYTNSIEQGRKRYAQVREAADIIDTGIPVTLKRYCTEFELALGPSDEYEWVPGTVELEKEIFAGIDVESIGKPALQPDYLIRHVLRKWMEFAWDRADETVTMFNDEEPLFTPSVTYHDKKETTNNG